MPRNSVQARHRRLRALAALVLGAALLVPLGTANAAPAPRPDGGATPAVIAPPWCGEPMLDAAENLPDGTDPTDPAGSFPHIPWYAIGCTLDDHRRAQRWPDGGRRGRPVRPRARHVRRDDQRARYASPRKAYQNWQEVRRIALTDPERAQALVARAGDGIKVPLFIQGGIHGNEYEGVDASMQADRTPRDHAGGHRPRGRRDPRPGGRDRATRSRTRTAGSPAPGRTATGST